MIAYDTEKEPLPAPGCYSVILYDNGNAAGIIWDTKVSLVPFDKVSEEYAYKEGGGVKEILKSGEKSTKEHLLLTIRLWKKNLMKRESVYRRSLNWCIQNRNEEVTYVKTLRIRLFDRI